MDCTLNLLHCHAGAAAFAGTLPHGGFSRQCTPAGALHRAAAAAALSPAEDDGEALTPMWRMVADLAQANALLSGIALPGQQAPRHATGRLVPTCRCMPGAASAHASTPRSPLGNLAPLRRLPALQGASTLCPSTRAACCLAWLAVSRTPAFGACPWAPIPPARQSQTEPAPPAGSRARHLAHSRWAAPFALQTSASPPSASPWAPPTSSACWPWILASRQGGPPWPDAARPAGSCTRAQLLLRPAPTRLLCTRSYSSLQAVRT